MKKPDSVLIAVIFGTFVMLAFYIVTANLAHAQDSPAQEADGLQALILDPRAAQSAYLTADPNNDDRLGLATFSGRYSVTPIQDCDGFADGQNVLIYPAFQLPPWLTISTPDGQPDHGCIVRIEGLRSNTPCYQIADQCDVSGEFD